MRRSKVVRKRQHNLEECSNSLFTCEEAISEEIKRAYMFLSPLKLTSVLRYKTAVYNLFDTSPVMSSVRQDCDLTLLFNRLGDTNESGASQYGGALLDSLTFTWIKFLFHDVVGVDFLCRM